MRAVFDYLKALYTWTKWTIQSLFLPKGGSVPPRELTEDEQLAQLDTERPGSDDQFHKWNEQKGHKDD